MLEQLIGGANFSVDEAEATLQLLLNEKNEARIAAFLLLLWAKGETHEEVCNLSELTRCRCPKMERNFYSH